MDDEGQDLRAGRTGERHGANEGQGRDEDGGGAGGPDGALSSGLGTGLGVPAPEGEGQAAPGDPVPPPALVEFMSGGWAPADPVVEAPAAAAPFHAARRQKLSARFPGDWLVVPTGGLKVRANDTDYRFRPGTDFAWLTGCQEPDCVLVLDPSHGGGHMATLYAAPRSDRSTPAFFTDRRYGELWVGPRLGLEETSTLLGISTASLEDLPSALKAAEGSTVRVVRALDARVDDLVDPAVDGDGAGDVAPAGEVAPAGDAGPAGAAAPAGDAGPAGIGGAGDQPGGDAVGATDSARVSADEELSAALSELRLVKDDHEIDCLADAIAATVHGFEDVVRALPDAQGYSERWVEGTFNRRARTEGNDVGYDTIAACGHHACTLHWVRNDGPVRPGELLLLDAGVEGPELYTADVTRTIPVSGRYSPAQREVYELVWRAQQAALAECRPGQAFLAPHRAAMRVLTEWLVDRSILTCSVEEALETEHRFYARYTLHGTSHMLGLDVHDCARARSVWWEGDLAAGMVLTVEPGCYLQPDDLTVPERYRGIGVRIEDDVLITGDGHRVLSEALPTRADQVEDWMAGLLQG